MVVFQRVAEIALDCNELDPLRRSLESTYYSTRSLSLAIDYK